jgi:hypothetical protein
MTLPACADSCGIGTTTSSLAPSLQQQMDAPKPRRVAANATSSSSSSSSSSSTLWGPHNLSVDLPDKAAAAVTGRDNARIQVSLHTLPKAVRLFLCACARANNGLARHFFARLRLTTILHVFL